MGCGASTPAQSGLESPKKVAPEPAPVVSVSSPTSMSMEVGAPSITASASTTLPENNGVLGPAATVSSLNAEPGSPTSPGSVTGTPGQSLSVKAVKSATSYGSNVSARSELQQKDETALKAFGKRNKPKKAASRFATSAGLTGMTGGGLAGFSSFGAQGSMPPITSENEKEASPDAEGSTVLDAKIAKFDIFDNLDENRMAEFEEIFAKVKETSNYEAHKKKNKKHNPNKFSTCTGVVGTDEETGNSMLS